MICISRAENDREMRGRMTKWKKKERGREREEEEEEGGAGVKMCKAAAEGGGGKEKVMRDGNKEPAGERMEKNQRNGETTQALASLLGAGIPSTTELDLDYKRAGFLGEF